MHPIGQGKGGVVPAPQPLESHPRSHGVREPESGPSACLGPATSAFPRATWGHDSSSSRGHKNVPLPHIPPSGLWLGGWARAIVCAWVGWHGNSEQEAGRSLIAICQAECQDHDEKKNQHQKKEVLASACYWLSHGLMSTSTLHRREKLTGARGRPGCRPGTKGNQASAASRGGQSPAENGEPAWPQLLSTRRGSLGPGCGWTVWQVAVSWS